MLTLPHRGLLVGGVILAELVLVAAAYQMANVVECYDTDAVAACRFLRSLAARALAVLAVGLILWRARPAAFAALAARAAAHPSPAPWAALHAAGLALIVLPLVLAGGGDLTGRFGLAAVPLAAGAVAAAAGGLFWLAPPAAWAALWRNARGLLAPALAVAVLIPDLAELAQPLWDLRGLSRATFAAVAGLLAAAGAAPYADPDGLILGVGDFAVVIARSCSGVEGFALVTAFVGLSALLFRESLRVGRFLAVVLPLGLVLSWLLNVVRIALLILIGAHVSPDLAVNGFHSHAGWLFFVLLALTILAVAQSVPWFRRPGGGEAASAAPALSRDPVAAMILPFVAFMLAQVAVRALYADPALGWPLIAAAMGAALAASSPSGGRWTGAPTCCRRVRARWWARLGSRSIRARARARARAPRRHWPAPPSRPGRWCGCWPRRHWCRWPRRRSSAATSWPVSTAADGRGGRPRWRYRAPPSPRCTAAG